MTPHVIKVPNVNRALQDGLTLLSCFGDVTESRNGKVLVAPGPVLTVYDRPWERVMFSALRDANPFFHLYECVWMLGGRSDVAAVARFAKTMDNFANSAGTMDGAYGNRWRLHFGFDQLIEVAARIKADTSTRRAVLAMWDPEKDLENGATSKDLPCNTHVYFDATKGKLEMTVCNRSNDIVWGAYGANVVHMSFLQEVLAAAVGVPMGDYCQFSNNYHTYLGRPDVDKLISPDLTVNYRSRDEYDYVHPYLLAVHGDVVIEDFLDDCETASRLVRGYGYSHPFFEDVFFPMMTAHAGYKQGDFTAAYAALEKCRASDWSLVANEWLQRRERAAIDKKLKGLVP